MVTQKLALSTGTSDLDHYLAVGNGRAAMTIDTSAALGTIEQLFAAGQYSGVELGVGPMPGPASADGGVLVGGAANYVVNRSSPAEQAAAYRFAKYLTAPEVQSEWAAATGYTPVSSAAAGIDPLAAKYRAQPEFKVAYARRAKGCAARSSMRSHASSISVRHPRTRYTPRPSRRTRRSTSTTAASADHAGARAETA
jgi:ABC-type glycerol-3-phosphate transport system substrate-binding protein